MHAMPPDFHELLTCAVFMSIAWVIGEVLVRIGSINSAMARNVLSAIVFLTWIFWLLVIAWLVMARLHLF